MSKRFVSTKEYKDLGPVAYHQWRDRDGNCNLLHGYSLSFYFEFESDSLDFRNWVVDYGSLKPLKDTLEDWFDHTLLVASDDPMYAELVRLGELGLAKITEVEATGCEALADFIYKWINSGFLQDLGCPKDVWCSKVQVRETERNMAFRQGHREDNEDLFCPSAMYRRN
jgi:6-pyruvoyltetrahydropterin/6-carboxytetrahydropterin synthase